MKAHVDRQGSLSTPRRTSIDIAHPTGDNSYESTQQLWVAVLSGKLQLGKLEEIGARLRVKTVKLDEAIKKLQLEVTYMDYTKELMNELDMASSPTLLQAATLLA